VIGDYSGQEETRFSAESEVEESTGEVGADEVEGFSAKARMGGAQQGSVAERGESASVLDESTPQEEEEEGWEGGEEDQEEDGETLILELDGFEHIGDVPYPQVHTPLPPPSLLPPSLPFVSW